MIVLKTNSDKFRPAKGMMLRDGLRHMPDYDNAVDLLVDMVVADSLQTLFQMDQFNSRPELQADLVTSQHDEETSYDLPAGEWRLTRKASGYRYTLSTE